MIYHFRYHKIKNDKWAMVYGKFQSGQSLIELLVTIGLVAIIIPALFMGFWATQNGRAQQDQRQQAIQLVREGQEAARVFREADWTTFSAMTGTVYAKPQGSTWILTSTSYQPISGFTRTITLSNVNRDPVTGNIATTGNPDPSTKEVTTSVCWGNPCAAPNQVTATEYLTHQANQTYTDTSVNDFNKGTFSSTIASSPTSNNTDSSGYVTLTQAGGADWCSPGTPIAHTDLGGNGLAGSVVAGVNRAFVGTGQNASSHPFYNVTIDYSGPAPNPSVAANGFYDTNGLKANDVYGETNYAYLATSHNGNRWVVILNVASNPPALVSTIASQNNNDATSIFVANNGAIKMLYFTAGSVLYRYDVTTPASPVAKGTFTLNAAANKLYVVNSIVYVALASTTNQLQIVDATNTTTMKNPGGGGAILKHLNSQPAISIFTLSDNSRTYLVTSKANPDFFILDTSTATNPVLKGTGFSTGNMDPKGLTVIDQRAIIVGFTNPRYQVLQVANDTYYLCNPTNDNEPDDIYNVSSQYVNGHAYSYITTSNTNSAFEMIEGGLGGGGNYTSPGTYTSGPSWSTTINPPLTAFNRVDTTINKPAGTDVQFEVGIASVGPSNTCADASFTFVGPSGPGTWFSSSSVVQDGVDHSLSIAVPLPPTSGWGSYIYPGQCFEYKAQLTNSTPTTNTPYVKDVTVSYSQ